MIMEFIVGGMLNGTSILSRKTMELMTTNHLVAELLPWAIFPELPDNEIF